MYSYFFEPLTGKSYFLRKERKLAELEEKWQATQATSKSIYAIWRSYSSSIVTNIVENLQVCRFCCKSMVMFCFLVNFCFE